MPPSDPLIAAWLIAECAAVNAEIEAERVEKTASQATDATTALHKAQALRAEADRLFREVRTA